MVGVEATVTARPVPMKKRASYRGHHRKATAAIPLDDAEEFLSLLRQSNHSQTHINLFQPLSLIVQNPRVLQRAYFQVRRRSCITLISRAN